ncbi:hypothetical protein KGA65_17935 [Ideonella sp. B7]|uniref:hypothetical protein n=1 Tax=Ideonella benzenivorans TaxID=2831643 RepID=UPI001CED7A7C|nr:hypothetical protein [Ideonella benzenivorans]MCA6218421.1 hypothetical protein [Ideonella benzenivorans]
MKLPLSLCAGLALALPAHADLTPLDTPALRAVAGQAAAPKPALPSLAALVAWLPDGSFSDSTLGPEQFLAQLRQHGLNDLPTALYDGRDVTQWVFADHPFDLRLDLAQWLAPQPTPSLRPLGTLSFSGLNLGGTVVWVWGH